MQGDRERLHEGTVLERKPVGDRHQHRRPDRYGLRVAALVGAKPEARGRGLLANVVVAATAVGALLTGREREHRHPVAN